MKPYNELTFTDDFLFSKIMRDESICKEVVELLLGIKVGRIEYLNSQSSIDEDAFSRGIRLDVYLKDSERVFDIEIQTSKVGDMLKRARYYQAMIDIDTLKMAEDYNKLKESYVLFICTFDPFGQGGYKYTFENTCKEFPNLNKTDKTKKIFYNTSAYSKSEDKNIQAFLQYLDTKEVNSDFTKRLDTAVYTAKGNDPWRVSYMTLGMKYDEFKQQGLAEGSRKKAIETAQNFIKMNFPLEQIAQGVGLPLEEIIKLKETNEQLMQNPEL